MAGTWEDHWVWDHIKKNLIKYQLVLLQFYCLFGFIYLFLFYFIHFIYLSL